MKKSNLVCVLLASLPFLVTACGGGSSAPVNAATGRNSGPNSDNDVWADIHRDDSGQEDHHLAFIYDNKSSYDVNFIGCQAMGGATVTESSIIAAGYATPRTQDYPNTMTYLDNGFGAINPSNVLDHNIHFTGNYDWPGDVRNCYYSIYVPEANDTLYFKLVMHKYDACSDAQLGCRLDLPVTQAAGKAAAYEMTPSALGFWNTALGLSLATTWNPYTLVKEKSVVTGLIPDPTTEAILNEGLDTQYQSFFDSLNRGLSDLIITKDRGYATKEKIDELKIFTRNYFSDKNLVSSTNIFTRSRTFDDDLTDMFRAGIRINVRMKGDNSIVGSLKTTAGEFSSQRYDFELTQEGWDALKARFKNNPNLANRLSDDIPFSLKDPGYKLPSAAEVLDILPPEMPKTVNNAAGILEDCVSYDAASAEVLERYSGVRFLSDPLETDIASNTLEQTMVKKFAVSDLTDPVLATTMILGGYFVLGALSADTPDGVGAFHSTLNHLRLDAVNADDVADWNATHGDDNPIVANTTVSTLVKDSLSNQVRLTFTDPKIDSQLNFIISLDAVSTPWQRSLNNGNTSKEWYLGDTSKSTGNKASAVMHVNITSSLDKANPIGEVMNAYRQIYQETYASSLTQIYTTLDAPSVSLNSLQSLKTGKYIYNRKAQRNGLLKAGANGFIKLQDGKLSGAYLNNGTTANLSVMLPTTNPGITNGLGLTAKYIDAGESGFNFLHEHNGNALAQFESYFGAESLEINPHLFTIFHCNGLPQTGQPCGLELTVKGLNDNVKRTGQIYIKDIGSNSASFPVYINYQIIAEPMSLKFQVGQGSNTTLYIENTSANMFQDVVLNGLDPAAIIKSNSCQNVDSGGQCQIVLDFSQCFDPYDGYGGSFTFNATPIGMDGNPTGAVSDDITVIADDVL